MSIPLHAAWFFLWLKWRNLNSLSSVQFACHPCHQDNMPDIAKSDISPNLDRDKMFSELWWLNYCFCEGVGIGAVGNPFFGGEAVNICLHSRCEMTDVGDPFCSNIRVCLCITDQCSLPPAPGSPICVCFNKKLAGGDGWSGQQLFDWSTSFGDTFWLYYIFCFGIGFSAPQANGRPLFAVQVKELCIKGGTKLATPMEGGKLCSSVSTRLCFWDQCAMPPAEGAPMFSCFNLLNSKGASAKPLAYGSWILWGCNHISIWLLALQYCKPSQPSSTCLIPANGKESKHFCMAAVCDRTLTKIEGLKKCALPRAWNQGVSDWLWVGMSRLLLLWELVFLLMRDYLIVWCCYCISSWYTIYFLHGTDHWTCMSWFCLCSPSQPFLSLIFFIEK